MTKLEHALRLAQQGFYVFRLQRDGKKPFTTGWQEEGTRDPEQIHALFHNHDFNIGVLTGKYRNDQALVVVDVDTKEDRKGNQTMLELDALGYDFPPTLTVTTASGGRHLIYAAESPLSGGANKIGLHVDLKSAGGYIVGAGSTINGTAYDYADNTTPIPCESPPWIKAKVGRAMERANADDIQNTDSDQALARAAKFVKENAETASSGQRNDTTFRVAAELRDIGISEPSCQNLMFEWNRDKCYPPMDQEEVEHTVDSVYKSAKRPLGASSPHAAFDPVPPDPKEPNDGPKKPPLYYVYPKEVSEENTEEHQLVEDLLDQGALSILYGDSNTGKTFVALDISYHIASGKVWNARRTTQGNVAYVAAEGGKSALNRIRALKRHYNDDDFPLALIPCSVNLFDSTKDIKALIALVQQAEADRGPIRLLVIDTLSRALAGGNENDSEDMGEFVKNLDIIRSQIRCHLLIVHHSGKDAARGARGHSLLRAAVDTELEVAENTITATKQRDMEFTKPIGFELTTITLGTNSYGKPITSCAVNLVDVDARATFNASNRLEPRDAIALQALKELQSGRVLNGYENVADNKTWAQCCKDFDISLVPGSVPWPQSDEGFRKAFRRSRDRLVGFNRVVEVVENQWAIQKVGQ